MAILVDDMIDGTHSFLDAAIHLKHCDASKVVIIATHGILSGDSVLDIQFCQAVDQVRLTETRRLTARS